MRNCRLLHLAPTRALPRIRSGFNLSQTKQSKRGGSLENAREIISNSFFQYVCLQRCTY